MDVRDELERLTERIADHVAHWKGKADMWKQSAEGHHARLRTVEKERDEAIEQAKVSMGLLANETAARDSANECCRAAERDRDAALKQRDLWHDAVTKLLERAKLAEKHRDDLTCTLAAKEHQIEDLKKERDAAAEFAERTGNERIELDRERAALKMRIACIEKERDAARENARVLDTCHMNASEERDRLQAENVLLKASLEQRAKQDEMVCKAERPHVERLADDERRIRDLEDHVDRIQKGIVTAVTKCVDITALEGRVAALEKETMPLRMVGPGRVA